MISNKQKLKTEWSNFLTYDVFQGDKYCYALTGTYYKSANISKAKVVKDIVHFKNVLDKQMLGNKYKKHGIRLPGFIVVEGQANGAHYHMHGCIQYYDLKQHIMERKKPFTSIWQNNISYAGKIKVEQVYDLPGWVNYTLKDRSKDAIFSDGVQIFHEFNERGKATQSLLN